MTTHNLKPQYHARTTTRLLACGMMVTPFFYAVSIVQMFTREGFDIKRHAISTLTLGDWGWVQSAAFIVTGLLALLAAIGARAVQRGTAGGAWGPLLLGLYGAGMAAAGFFRPDPGQGFPEGAPEGMPAAMSAEAAIHMLAFILAFLSLIAANVVYARRYAVRGEAGWRNYCVATAIIAPLLIAAGMGIGEWVGVMMGCAGLVAFGWVSALAWRLRMEAGRQR